MGEHPHSPGPLWPPGQGTGGADSSILPSKEVSVLFSFKRQLICGGDLFAEPFSVQFPREIVQIPGGSLWKSATPSPSPTSGRGGSVTSWSPRLSKQSGPGGGGLQGSKMPSLTLFSNSNPLMPDIPFPRPGATSVPFIYL